MGFLKRDPVKQLQRKLERCERDARYVSQQKRRQDVIEAIRQAWLELEQDNIRQAKTHLHEAKYHFALARVRNQLLFYRTAEALGISVVYLILFLSVTASAIWLVPIERGDIVFSILIALSGGGIGGVTTVLSKVVGLQLETQAVTNRVTWYIVKPILGAIMGLVTYFAVLSGLSLLSNALQIDNLSGVFLIGFLGGYFESFSTRVLNELADRVVGIKESEVSETGRQSEEINASNNQ